MAFSICKLCNTEHHAQSGFFTRHLKDEHDLSLKEYVVRYEYNGIAPICQCGYCNESPNFKRGKFSTHTIGHKKYDYLKEQYIKLNGVPKCPKCDNNIESWDRGKPRKYCKGHCKYDENSKRMIEYNRDWVKNHKVKKYKETDLYYQSLYELEFLELCEELGVLDNISNGNSYKCDNKYLKNIILTDFSIDNIEIEIKSSYIMKQQGGLKVLNAKRKTVENTGKQYIIILDKDYSEFLETIKL